MKKNNFVIASSISVANSILKKAEEKNMRITPVKLSLFRLFISHTV